MKKDCLNILTKNNFKQEFNYAYKYKDLPYNSFLAITIRSCDRDYIDETPLASTIVSLFDDKTQLRQGVENLLLWQEQLPDCSISTKTPGLVSDKNIRDLNYYNQQK